MSLFPKLFEGFSTFIIELKQSVQVSKEMDKNMDFYRVNKKKINQNLKWFIVP